MSVGAKARHFRLPILQGLLPLRLSQLPANTIAGATLAALAIPKVMGYTRLAGTQVVTGLYTLLLPMALFAVFGSSRHLVVGADSATAVILAGGLAGLAAPNSPEWLALAGFSACSRERCCSSRASCALASSRTSSPAPFSWASSPASASWWSWARCQPARP